MCPPFSEQSAISPSTHTLLNSCSMLCRTAWVSSLTEKTRGRRRAAAAACAGRARRVAGECRRPRRPAAGRRPRRVVEGGARRLRREATLRRDIAVEWLQILRVERLVLEREIEERVHRRSSMSVGVRLSRSIAVARPVAGSAVTITPCSRGIPDAVSNLVGRPRQEATDDRAALDADHAVVRTGHADVGAVGRALRAAPARRRSARACACRRRPSRRRRDASRARSSRTSPRRGSPRTPRRRARAAAPPRHGRARTGRRWRS